MEQVFFGKTYDVSPYDSQRSYPSMNLGVKWDLCVLFEQTAVNVRIANLSEPTVEFIALKKCCKG